MKIVTAPADVLDHKLKPVLLADLKSGVHDELIDEMRKDMVTSNGIGLAANQVGEDLALFVIDAKLAEEHEVSDVYANPTVTNFSRELDELEEGCLSIPGYWVPVHRSKKIMFKALDGKGAKVKFRARGMLARVLQHETDHINGTTIKQRTNK
jgi:peptide deformylase